MMIQGAADAELKTAAIEQGMKTLKMKGMQQVLEGTTTLDDLARVVDMRED